MNIKIICVGKLKEKYLKMAQDEYLKRLGPYAKVEVIEIKDEDLYLLFWIVSLLLLFLLPIFSPIIFNY